MHEVDWEVCGRSMLGLHRLQYREGAGWSAFCTLPVPYGACREGASGVVGRRLLRKAEHCVGSSFIICDLKLSCI